MTKRIVLAFLALAALLAACGAPKSELIIINNSSASFCELHLSPTTDENWGADILGGHTIDVGATHTQSGIEPGVYDVQLVPCDQNAFEIYERYELDLSTDIELTLSDQ
jgi:hypothetical protein